MLVFLNVLRTYLIDDPLDVSFARMSENYHHMNVVRFIACVSVFLLSFLHTGK